MHDLAASPSPASQPPSAKGPLARLDAWVGQGESVLVAAALALAAGPAAASFLLRATGLGGSPWLDLVPRFATLAVAFIGASLATQAGSHIALDLLHKALPSVWSARAKTVAELVAAAASAVLTVATWRFIVAERDGGSLIAGAVPSWLPALVMLWGFAVSAVRFTAHALARLPLFAGVSSIVLVSILAGATWYGTGSSLVGIALVAGIIAGTPIFVVLGGAALLFFSADGVDLAVVPIEIYRLAEAPTLVTLPLFTLLGGVLARSEAPARLVTLARSWLGWLPGGLAIAAVVVCAFFTTFTGASGVTILALGLLLHRLLTEEGYEEGVSIGLVTSSGSIGLLFAPALPLIVYGIVGKVDISELFKAGVAPGLLLMVAVAATALLASRKSPRKRHAFVWADARRALRVAAFDVAVPVMVLALILTGLATVVEAAAVAVLYVAVVALWVKRDLALRQLGRIATESGVLIGTVLVILGLAVAFTGYLVDAEVPQQLIEWSRTHVSSRWAFLLVTNLLLLVVGCLLDIFSAIIIFVPLLAPVGAAFGVHPLHLAMIFLANLELGYLTPPVGMNLFLSSHRFHKPMPEIWRSVAPYLMALGVALLIITYVPALSLWSVP
jgi:C4-dicarboxylate transporter, DctM subunit